jgi:ABC-type sugar transport system ATPase subunit
MELLAREIVPALPSVDQRQRVEIARALLLGARCIILDEPTARLEAREIARLFERIRQLKGPASRFCTSLTISKRCMRSASV